MNKKNIDLIRQALAAAESSIKLAKQLLNEAESGKGGTPSQSSDFSKNTPGIVGKFDGENMITDSGETFPVPSNYASKSMLVVGDTLKMVEESGDKRFKQIEHLKRYRTNGIITKKDGKWKAITPEGSYKVSPSSVEHLKAEVGSEVVLHLPAGNLNVAYAAIESVKKSEEVTKKEQSEQKSPKEVEDKTNSAVAITPLPKKEADKPSEKPQQDPAVKKEPVAKTALIEKTEEKPKTISPEPKKTAEKNTKTETPKSVEGPKQSEPKKAEPETVVKTESNQPSQPVAAPMEISPEEDELT